MGFFRTRFGRRTEPDGGFAGNQRRPVGLLRARECIRDGLRIVTVDTLGGPACCLKTLYLID